MTLEKTIESGEIIPTDALRDMVRNYQINHPESQLCAELLSLDDSAFLARLDRVFEEAERSKI